MGVIYKLKPEVKDFILEQKKNNPNVSCRNLSSLVQEKFQVKVSKSSINAIFKESGLSMPVGRRRIHKKRKLEMISRALKNVQLLSPAETKLLETKIEKPVEIKPEERKIEEPAQIQAEKVIELPPAVEKPQEAPEEISVEKPVQIPVGTHCTGAILLKAIDSLLGGAQQVTNAIKIRLGSKADDLLAKTEAILYGPLFNLSADIKAGSDFPLWPLVNRALIPQEIYSHLNELQQIVLLKSDISRIIPSLFKEILGIRLELPDKQILYLDGQMHTLWPSQNIPSDFSSTLHKTRDYIKKHFNSDLPVVFLAAPGFDAPTKELFELIKPASTENYFIKLSLFDHKLKEFEDSNLEMSKQKQFVFGLWPWQYVKYRKVKNISEFKPFLFEPLNKSYYLAEAEIELYQSAANKVTLNGCAIKTNINDKIRMLILTNLPSKQANISELAAIYLNQWPNIEEAIEDFNRKVELFTYTADSQRFFSTENLNLALQEAGSIGGILKSYLELLDAYFRWFFLPPGNENSIFATTKERFYNLEVELKHEEGAILAIFKPPSEYPFLKDLQYALRRLNEREVFFLGINKRIWFVI